MQGFCSYIEKVYTRHMLPLWSKGHWSRTYQTLKYLINFYQASSRLGVGYEVNEEHDTQLFPRGH